VLGGHGGDVFDRLLKFGVGVDFIRAGPLVWKPSGAGNARLIQLVAHACGILNGAVAPASMTWVVPVT
jgi:hypothetical protein